jgi:hypothetical protein
MVLLSRWRTISGVLLPKTYGQSTLSQNDPRLRNIIDARRSLDSILRPYAKEPSDNDERLRKLEDLLKRAARFGYLIFSQPSQWEFRWDNDQGAARKDLTIFPALLQVADEDGNPLQKPRVLEEQEVVEVVQCLT